MSKMRGCYPGLRGLLLRGREIKPPSPCPPPTLTRNPNADLLLQQICRGGSKGIDEAQNIYSQWEKLPWASLTSEINDSANRKPLRRGQNDQTSECFHPEGLPAASGCSEPWQGCLCPPGSDHTASRPQDPNSPSHSHRHSFQAASQSWAHVRPEPGGPSS